MFTCVCWRILFSTRPPSLTHAGEEIATRALNSFFSGKLNKHFSLHFHQPRGPTRRSTSSNNSAHEQRFFWTASLLRYLPDVINVKDGDPPHSDLSSHRFLCRCCIWADVESGCRGQDWRGFLRSRCSHHQDRYSRRRGHGLHKASPRGGDGMHRSVRRLRNLLHVPYAVQWYGMTGSSEGCG